MLLLRDAPSTGGEAAPPLAQDKGSEVMLKLCPKLPDPQALSVLCCLPATLMALGPHGHFPIPVPTTPHDQADSTDHGVPYWGQCNSIKVTLPSIPGAHQNAGMDVGVPYQRRLTSSRAVRQLS